MISDTKTVVIKIIFPTKTLGQAAAQYGSFKDFPSSCPRIHKQPYERRKAPILDGIGSVDQFHDFLVTEHRSS